MTHFTQLATAGLFICGRDEKTNLYYSSVQFYGTETVVNIKQCQTADEAARKLLEATKVILREEETEIKKKGEKKELTAFRKQFGFLIRI